MQMTLSNLILSSTHLKKNVSAQLHEARDNLKGNEKNLQKFGAQKEEDEAQIKKLEESSVIKKGRGHFTNGNDRCHFELVHSSSMTDGLINCVPSLIRRRSQHWFRIQRFLLIYGFSCLRGAL